jgi:hypothetical protein
MRKQLRMRRTNMATIQESRGKLQKVQDRSQQKISGRDARDRACASRENMGRRATHQERVEELQRYGSRPAEKGKWKEYTKKK